MKIFVIMATVLVAQVSGSFFDVFQDAVLSVQSSFTKLFSDVVTDVKDTVDCTILAAEYVLAISEESTARYLKKCANSKNSPESDSQTKSYSSVLDISIAKNDHYLKKETPDEISVRITERLTKCIKGCNNDHQDKLEDVHQDLCKATERLADVSNLVREQLKKFSNEIHIDILRIESKDFKPSVDTILEDLKVLQDVEHNIRNCSEANEIHNLVHDVLHKLHDIESWECKQNIKVDSILKDLEKADSNYKDMRLQVEEWKTEKTRHLNLINFKIEEHEKLREHLEYIDKNNTLVAMENVHFEQSDDNAKQTITTLSQVSINMTSNASKSFISSAPEHFGSTTEVMTKSSVLSVTLTATSIDKNNAFLNTLYPKPQFPTPTAKTITESAQDPLSASEATLQTTKLATSVSDARPDTSSGNREESMVHPPVTPSEYMNPLEVIPETTSDCLNSPSITPKSTTSFPETTHEFVSSPSNSESTHFTDPTMTFVRSTLEGRSPSMTVLEPATYPIISSEPTSFPMMTRELTSPPMMTLEPTSPPMMTVEPTSPPMISPEHTSLPMMTQEPTSASVKTLESTSPPVMTLEPTSPPMITLEPTSPPMISSKPTCLPMRTQEPTSRTMMTQEPISAPMTNLEPTNPPMMTVEPTSPPMISPEHTSLPMMTQELTSPPMMTLEPTSPPMMTVEPTSPPMISPEHTSLPMMTQEPTSDSVKTLESTSPPVMTLEPTSPPMITLEPTSPPMISSKPTCLPMRTQEPTSPTMMTQEPISAPMTNLEPTNPPMMTVEPMTAKNQTLIPMISPIPYNGHDRGNSLPVPGRVQPQRARPRNPASPNKLRSRKNSNRTQTLGKNRPHDKNVNENGVRSHRGKKNLSKKKNGRRPFKLPKSRNSSR